MGKNQSIDNIILDGDNNEAVKRLELILEKLEKEDNSKKQSKKTKK